MAEQFNNYCTKGSINKGTKRVIVPTAGTSLSNGIGTRTANSTLQIHSIYIVKEQGGVSPTPESDSAKVSLILKDGNNEYKMGDNILILPNSAFYIEKTITLLPTQSLLIEYTSVNSSSSNIHTICSSVDIY